MKFTWSNNRIDQAWARLDRFLISPEILLWFPHFIQKGLPRGLLDHNPVLLREENLEWGPSPFRFLNWWLEDKEMMGAARRGWTDCKIAGSKGFILFSKAKASKVSLKIWLNFNKSNKLNSKILEERLGEVDAKAVVEGGRSHFVKIGWLC